MFFGRSKNWRSSVNKLHKSEITVCEFVSLNQAQTLYHSLPFISDERGDRPNVLHSHENNTEYFPVFTTVSALRDHLHMIGAFRYTIIKGNLKGVLDSLDSHPITKEWGVVIDPQDPLAVEIPPMTSVKP